MQHKDHKLHASDIIQAQASVHNKVITPTKHKDQAFQLHNLVSRDLVAKSHVLITLVEHLAINTDFSLTFIKFYKLNFQN